ncbi:MAG: autotransporter outer membrane beta-barrel domain-containing protein [Nitrospira sp.]|nr:autotransporter outer membrane beta-barrel domain-containing protein [Nitrospira sp.]
MSTGKKALLGLFLIAMVSPSEASAQVLNQQVDALLANNCAGLGTGGFPTPNLTGLGPDLAALCDVPQTTGVVSTGGGAASVQGAPASILNRTLFGRFEDLKQEGKDGTGRPTAMLFNPLGLMSLGTLRDVSIASPFYAATNANAGSPLSFMTGSPGRWNGLGLFASGLAESLNRDVTTFQDGFKSRILGFSAGLDYRFSKKLVSGLVGSFSNTDGDFQGGGTFNTNSYGVLGFVQLIPTDRTFIQGTAGYTRNDYSIDRLATAQVSSVAVGADRFVNSIAASDSNSNVLNLGALAGYDHPIGRFVVGPRVGVNYSQTHIGAYAETGGGGIGLQYNDQLIHSLQSTVGIQGSTIYSVPFGVLVHQVNADYFHEFANSQRLIDVQFTEDLRATPTRFAFQNDVPVRNYGYVGTGLVAVLRNGWQPFVNFRAMVGNGQFDNYIGTFGVRIEL